MPRKIIANFDAGRIPDVADETNFHLDATYVFDHMASDIIPGINTNLNWMNAALAGAATLVDAVADLQDLVGGTTAFAKTLLNDANAAQSRTTLGLGTAAVRNVRGDANLNFAGAFPAELSSRANIAAFVDRKIEERTLGVGQVWQNVWGSRSVGTSYQNTSGQPIYVAIECTATASGESLQASANNSTWINIGRGSNAGNYYGIIPANNYYRLQGGANIQNWAELR